MCGRTCAVPILKILAAHVPTHQKSRLERRSASASMMGKALPGTTAYTTRWAASATSLNEVAVVGVEFYDALGRWLQFRSLSAFIHVVFGTSRDHEANGEVPRLWWENAHAWRVGGVRRDRSAVFWIFSDIAHGVRDFSISRRDMHLIFELSTRKVRLRRSTWLLSDFHDFVKMRSE